MEDKRFDASPDEDRVAASIQYEFSDSLKGVVLQTWVRQGCKLLTQTKKCYEMLFVTSNFANSFVRTNEYIAPIKWNPSKDSAA